MAVVTTVAIILGIFFALLYFAGVAIGQGIVNILQGIHPIAWFVILFFALIWITKRNK